MPNASPQGIPRPVEAALALAGLAATAPLLAAAAVAVRLGSPGPVLFRQQRVGRGGRPFTLLKLRSMLTGSAGAQVTAGGDPRVTPVGAVLRKLKIDELPELWNVVRGDMSIVGPRPEVPRYVDLDDPLWREALEARPGITDPVTLRLRNEEDLLAAVDGDREAFYRQALQPFKLLGYCDYLRARTWRTDVGVVFDTLLAVLVPSRAPAPDAGAVVREVAARRPHASPTTEAEATT
jgi:lipopolysaccharide/colanic/teichoic acid biosynthesis glycosyltransferase